jgi:hypothetical protein
VSGTGTMIYYSTQKYVGEFHGGNRNGQGTMIYLDGRVYAGEFREGKRTGYRSSFLISNSGPPAQSIVEHIIKHWTERYSTTQTVHLRAWLTILLEILPKRNSSLRESPCLPSTMVLYPVSSRSDRIHFAIEGQ